MRRRCVVDAWPMRNLVELHSALPNYAVEFSATAPIAHYREKLVTQTKKLPPTDIFIESTIDTEFHSSFTESIERGFFDRETNANVPVTSGSWEIWLTM